MRKLLGLIGVALVLSGGLFLLQGTDVINWPADSFMIGQRVWIERGAIMVALGAILIVWARLSGAPR